LKYDLQKEESVNGEDGFFALGAFSGIHRENYTLCNEVCAVTRCINTTDCGDGISDGLLGFRHLHLQGNFSQGTYRFPTVLVDDAKLAPSATWTFTEFEGLEFVQREDISSLVFAIYGRCFNQDP
jgi:Vanin C-terminal domain